MHFENSPCLRASVVNVRDSSIIPRMNRRDLSEVGRDGGAWVRARRRARRRRREAAAGAAAADAAPRAGQRRRGIASSARRSACVRIGRPGSCCAPTSSMARRSIHNFGHGGSGMSLSWGTASMATDLAMPHTERKAAVLGSGVVGLTSARELQRHGFDVTIYAATVPPDTTSNMSLAGWTPTSGLVDNTAAHAAVGRAVPAGGAHRVSAAAVADRSEVRRHLGHAVPADRQRSGRAAAPIRIRCCPRSCKGRV